ncbi:unnamed protein product, partial [Aureobasidium vineae]
GHYDFSYLRIDFSNNLNVRDSASTPRSLSISKTLLVSLTLRLLLEAATLFARSSSPTSFSVASLWYNIDATDLPTICTHARHGTIETDSSRSTSSMSVVDQALRAEITAQIGNMHVLLSSQKSCILSNNLVMNVRITEVVVVEIEQKLEEAFAIAVRA